MRKGNLLSLSLSINENFENGGVFKNYLNIILFLNCMMETRSFCGVTEHILASGLEVILSCDTGWFHHPVWGESVTALLLHGALNLGFL